MTTSDPHEGGAVDGSIEGSEESGPASDESPVLQREPRNGQRRYSAPYPCLVETVQQRARRLGLSELTIRRRMRHGSIEAFRIGGTWRLPAPDKGSVHDLPAVCSVRQVANSLAVSELTVRRWINAGDLPAVKTGRTWVIHRSSLEELLGRRDS